ncbi:MAG: nuclear transport factor 2 family protein [Hahellaceae bacterium]|nr:nuclear transport factor 2 family protein [Hahellaceae bacterium]MCP5169231.1 nuclear transport factor 2 family protein [Hahellaceae bacterium]
MTLQPTVQAPLTKTETQQHTDLLNRFYRAFQNKDYATMQACYHPDAEFQDEVFTLKGKEIGAMWHMLCERGKDLTLEFGQVTADAQTGRAFWQAGYTFSTTGRYVVNKLNASFEFKDGKIIRHRDRFNFWKWSRQALGPAGLLLGWGPLLHRKVSKMASQNLQKFMAGHSEYRGS